MKTTVFFITILLTGLSAGLFYAWEVSVITGTKRVGDLVYVETMQSINRAIINPAFMLIFLGSFFMQVLSLFQFKTSPVFVYILIGTLIYFGGTLLVTGLGNVPLNDALDVLSIDSLSDIELHQKRMAYESKWNFYHTLRTIFSVLSFIVLLLAAFINQNNSL